MKKTALLTIKYRIVIITVFTLFNGPFLFGQSQVVNGDLFIGQGNHDQMGQGNAINYIGNTDNCFITQFNAGFNKTEFRFNFGDDISADDRFVVGITNSVDGQWRPYLVVQGEGNVGIGTTSPDAKLAVKGTVHAQEVKVDLNIPGPDFVFDPGYPIPELRDVQKFILKNKHLPEVPSAWEMEQNGIDLGRMNMKLLQKVEELTLYLIEKDREVKSQRADLKAQSDKNLELEARVAKLEALSAKPVGKK